MIYRTPQCKPFRQVIHRSLRIFVSLLLLMWSVAEAFVALALPFPNSLNHETSGGQDIHMLEPGKPIEREIASHERHSYQITISAGQFLYAAIDQISINVGATLFGPDGKPLLEIDHWLEMPERVWWIAESTGIYRLEVSTGKEKPGRYQVRIVELRPAIQLDRLRMTARNTLIEGIELRSQETQESLSKSLQKLKEARQLWQTLDEPSMEALALWQMIIACNSIGEYQQAIEYGNQALLLRPLVSERHWVVNILLFIGEAYHSLSDYQKALEFTQQSLPIWQAMEDPVGEAWTLNNIGAAYNAFGEKKKALEYFHKSLLAYQSVGDNTGQALEHTQIGAHYASMGEKQKALDSLEKALALWRIVTDPSRRDARTFYRLGEVYASLGESQLALDYYDRALRRLREKSDPLVESRILNSIGQVYVSIGKYQESLDHFNQALQLRRKIGNRQGEAYTLTYLGTVYFSLGDKRQALDCYNQALPLLRDVGDRYGEAYTLTYLGEVYSSLDDQQKALDYYLQALPLRQAVEDREGEAHTRYQITRVERARGNLDEAREQVKKAIEITEFVRTSVLSQELRASYLATVRDYYELYVDLLMRLHERNQSQGFAALALQASEKDRARSLLDTLAEAHAEIRQGIDPQLLERERDLQRQLNAKADYQTKILNGRRTPKLAEDAAKEVRALTSELQQVRAQIKATSPRYAALAQSEPLSAAQIQQEVVDDNTMLLEFALGDERSYLWAVTPTTIKSYVLPKRTEIEAAARRVYDLMTVRSHRADDKTKGQRQADGALADTQCLEAAAVLSQMLLGPVASQLGTKRLIIVPQGALQLIPFAALPVPISGSQLSTARGKTASKYYPLIVDHEIVSLPSASTLAALRRDLAGRKPAPKTVTVLADPVFSEDDDRVRTPAAKAVRKSNALSANSSERESRRNLERALRDLGDGTNRPFLTRLFGTQWEAEQIITLAPRDKSMKALGFDANRATATNPELGKYQIIHYATHALINQVHPELSGIVLSLVDQQGHPQDGFLRAHELFNLKLPAELVVLSACQTGLGKEIKGEGMVGLTQGFMYAGAARVMASLWSLDDKMTAELMVRFYKRMLGSQALSPAAALRAAQIEMWKDQRWRAPYYWAGFVLQGEWK